MKRKIIACLLVTGIITASAFTCGEQEATSKNMEPMMDNKDVPTAIAVIELFTSQGCSSCPPADQLLNKTISNAREAGKNIFALSFHVDYWNRLGWTDPFSNSKFSERQRNYASNIPQSSVYTPQMLVNGTREFVGSDQAKLNKALIEALNTAAIASFSTLTYTENGTDLQVNYQLQGDYKNAIINFALVSLSETTSIKRGENSGLTITNENVVRQFTSVAAEQKGSIHFKTSPLPTQNNRAIVAYIQNNNNFKIIGAAKAIAG